MAFSREDLAAYEAKTAVNDPNHDPWSPNNTTPAVPELGTNPEANLEADVDAAIDASVTEPTAKGDNDGSTTEPQAEPVAADNANPEGDKDPDLEEATDGRPRSRAQERIEELVAERNANREYSKYLLEQINELRKLGQPAKTESRPTESAPIEDSAPTLETAEFDPVKLSKLQNEWIQKQVEKRVESAVRQIENRQSEAATRQAFAAKVEEFRKTVPDFELVISNPALPQLAPEAARVVVRSDNGPAIAYHLGKNPDLAARISRMEPISQAAAIGRLEEQLVRTKTEGTSTQKEPSKDTKQAPAKAAPAKVTQAPPPPKPVSSSTGVIQKPGDIMSMEEWVANERSKKIASKQARLKMRQAMR